MATIQRPVKTYGTRTYVGEVAAAPGNEAPVLSNEVDADLDTVYAAWNGGTDTVNLKDLSVTTAKLADAPSGVSTGKLNDNAVTAAKLATNAVTLAKILPGATRRNSVGAAPTAGQVITGPATGVTVLTLPALATVGGIVWLFGTLGWRYAIGGGQADLTFVVRRNGVQFWAATFSTFSSAAIWISPPTPMLIDTPTAGTQTYTLVVSTSTNGTLVVHPADVGVWNAYEFA